MQPGRPTVSTMIALAGPAAPMAALSLPLIIYLPEFFSNALGLNLALVGLMFTVVRLADLAFDPFVGGLMDRTMTRFGQFRPWLAIGVPVVIAGTVMLFMAERGAGALRLSVGLALGYAGYSIVILAQMGLGTELTSDYRQRSRVFAWWQAFNGLGLVLVLMLPVVLPLMFGEKIAQDSGFTVRTMGWFVVVTLPLTALMCIARVHENPVARIIEVRRGTGCGEIRSGRRRTCRSSSRAQRFRWRIDSIGRPRFQEPSRHQQSIRRPTEATQGTIRPSGPAGPRRCP